MVEEWGRMERARNTKGQFIEGAVGNPTGRPVGVKNAISHAFLTDLQALWEHQGPAVLKRIAKKNPQAILAAMVSLVPKAQVVDETQRVYIIRDTPPAIDWRPQHDPHWLRGPLHHRHAAIAAASHRHCLLSG
jgi:hypothetical protein